MKKVEMPGHKPSIAQRNSLFKCKTKISGLFSKPMRLHRQQCSQWMGDMRKGKSFLGIKRHCRKTLSKETICTQSLMVYANTETLKLYT